MAKINTIALKIPNLGEAESTEIIEVNIKVGDKVNVNDPLIVLESEKAAMEVPSDFQGEISEILIKEGDSVHEGMEFAKIKAETEVKEAEVKEEKEKEIVKEEKIINRPTIDFTGINAGPAVRKYARELEIDLSIIAGTGKNKRITKEDLKNHIHSNKSGLSLKTYKENDFVDEGSFKIQKLSKIQSLGAKNLHESWVTIPHVTHFEEADLAAINKLRKSKKSSVLAYFVHALCQILKEFPSFNSSLVDGDNLLLKDYINIGIAVDTEMGLVVPVIKDADKLSVENISKKIEELAGKARDRKLFEKDLTGATFTVSSLGKIGGIGFTPIINPPEVGIISISRSRNNVELQNGEIKEKVILPFGLSYDHRVINGADAGRFSLALKEKLESLS